MLGATCSGDGGFGGGGGGGGVGCFLHVAMVWLHVLVWSVFARTCFCTISGAQAMGSLVYGRTRSSASARRSRFFLVVHVPAQVGTLSQFSAWIEAHFARPH
jgi:hypothetical protein